MVEQAGLWGFVNCHLGDMSLVEALEGLNYPTAPRRQHHCPGPLQGYLSHAAG